MLLALSSLRRAASAAGLALVAALGTAKAEGPVLTYGGAGWMQLGAIGHSSDTVKGTRLNGRQLLTSGAHLTLHAGLSEMLEGMVGLGVVAGNFIAPSVKANGGYAPSYVGPYVVEASVTYSFWKAEQSKLSLKAGLFPYNYNPEVSNLGLYLMRGPIYPGVLVSGFEDKYVNPLANTLGLWLHHELGGFSQDFLLSSETEYYPFFDISPVYVASYRFGKVFRLGAGANFAHLISVDDSITNGKSTLPAPVYIDTAGGKQDTTFFDFRGIKVMANASLDPKPWFGNPAALGDEDLKLYAEVGLIGLNNSKAYRETFGDMSHRMPVSVGFNLPAFRFLDRLSLEVEWYGAKFPDDLSGYEHTRTNYPTPVPVASADANLTRDNWKWSLYGAKVIQNHFKISAQLANDHFRPGLYTGDGDNAPPSSRAVMMTPKDWYGMAQLAYFF